MVEGVHSEFTVHHVAGALTAARGHDPALEWQTLRVPALRFIFPRANKI